MCPNWALGVVYAQGCSPPVSYETLLWLHEELSVLSNLKFAFDEIKQIPSFTGLTNFTQQYGIDCPEITTLDALRTLEDAVLRGHNGAGDSLTLMNQILSLRTLKSVSCFDLKKIEGNEIHFRPGFAHESYLSPLGKKHSLQHLPLYADKNGFIGGPTFKTDYMTPESTTIVTLILSLEGMEDLYSDMALLQEFYKKYTSYNIFHMEIVDGFPGVIDINRAYDKSFTPIIPFML